MSKQTQSLYEKIINDIGAVAEALGKSPSDLTVKEYLSNGAFKANDLTACGGLKAIVKDAFEIPEKHAGIVTGQKLRAAYVRKLEKVAGHKEYVFDQVADKISQIAASLSPEKRTIKFGKPKNFLRGNVGVLSDTHFGLDIDRDEVKYNEYNWEIAARRFAKYIVQLAEYKKEHRDDCPTVWLCLGGDICQGLIHADTEFGTEMITHQVDGASQMIHQGIEYLRKHYKYVNVVCTPDNHMRLPFAGGGRSMSQKYDSFATIMHLGLARAYANVPEVQFHIVKTPYTDFEVLGHRVFLTHGDTTLNAGSPGKNINVERISKRVNEIQVAAFSNNEKPYRAVIMGHVHVPVSTTLTGGIELIINGTASGLDPYARAIGITSSDPCQVIFEATEDYVVGDFRKVYLKDADKVAAYDQIITPYDRQFTHPMI